MSRPFHGPCHAKRSDVLTLTVCERQVGRDSRSTHLTEGHAGSLDDLNVASDELIAARLAGRADLDRIDPAVVPLAEPWVVEHLTGSARASAARALTTSRTRLGGASISSVWTIGSGIAASGREAV